jgi:hypothetical protein
MKKNEFDGALYFAVGAFSVGERAQRDRARLKAAGRGIPGVAARRPGPGPGPGPGPMVRSVVFGMTPLNPFLEINLRAVAAHDEAVALDFAVFKPGWPGQTAAGNPRDAQRAFASWLTSAEGKALFAHASGVTLYAIDLNVERAPD